jgi:hypothetical protein
MREKNMSASTYAKHYSQTWERLMKSEERFSAGEVRQPKRVDDMDYVVQAGAAAEQRGCFAAQAVGLLRQQRGVARADCGIQGFDELGISGATRQ